LNNFAPLVDINKEFVQQWKDYCSNLEEIYELINSEEKIDSLGDMLVRIQYHLVNILILKRLLSDEMEILQSYINNPDSASNYQLHKVIRYIFINTESLLEAIKLAVNNDKKRIEGIEFNIDQQSLPNIKAFRNHSVHEGIFGIITPRRPAVISHGDVVTPPTDTRGFYIVDDNGEHHEFLLTEIRPNFVYRINRCCEEFFHTLVEYLKHRFFAIADG
jgi:hypothetical protein